MSKQQAFSRVFDRKLVNKVHSTAQRVIRINARHSEIQKAPGVGDTPVDRLDVEADELYRRADMSHVFAFEARVALAKCFERGEPHLSLAEAALQICAEDDAIASHSTVRFPVEAYMDRISRLTDDVINDNVLSGVTSCSSYNSNGVNAKEEAYQQAARLSTYLFAQRGYKAPAQGRSALPKRAVLDHPGVWEDARLAYLSDVLVRRVGAPSALAVLLVDIARRLAAAGHIDWVMTISDRCVGIPGPSLVLPGLRSRNSITQPDSTSSDMLTASDGSSSSITTQKTTPPTPREAASSASDVMFNADSRNTVRGGESGPRSSSSTGLATSHAQTPYSPMPYSSVLNAGSSDLIIDLLRHLKRAYWPFGWDTNIDDVDNGGFGSGGGFRAAAKLAIGEDMSAELSAIGVAAAWRLKRGISTSPGAGDMARAVAAAERLAMLVGDRMPEERRDLAVLLFHIGRFDEARSELTAYMDSGCINTADPFDVQLCRQMMKSLQQLCGPNHSGSPISISTVLAMDMPLSSARLPLTW